MYLTTAQCARRYKKIIQKIKSKSPLTTDEIAIAIREYRSARTAMQNKNPFAPYLGNSPTALGDSADKGWVQWGENIMKYGGGEAVANAGGPQTVINLLKH